VARSGEPRRHHWVFWSAVVVVAVAVLVVGLSIARREVRARRFQNSIAAFYEPPADFAAAAPGAILRIEPLGTEVPGGTGWRILYRSERTDGTPTVSSGMLFVPAGAAPAEGRDVVAWAHGTVGLGTECAPSRTEDPLKAIAWVPGMLAAGFVVVATDYAGLGTPGVERYLIGRDEARDVINSVRAARAVPEAGAGSRFAVYGHSQGGQSSLWTGTVAPVYAPELSLVAITAAAPAAELAPLVSLQQKTAIGWVIGPEVVVSWPLVYPELDPSTIVTKKALRVGAGRGCIVEQALEGLVRTKLGQQYFAKDPSQQPQWRAALDAQSPPPLPASVPVLVGQGLKDDVVLPETTALLQQRWCAAGADLTMVWLGDLSHMAAGLTVGPLVSTWLQERFAGTPASTNCGTLAPVAAAVVPPMP